jgi:uncharacterized protein YllA (UPF0747 family)
MAFDAYRVDKTFGDASMKLAKSLYGHLHLNFFRPDEKAFRDFSRPYLVREFEKTEVGEQTNGFILDERKKIKTRKALYRTEKGFATREGETISLSDFVLLPNVQTRSVIQDAFFQATAYIAGPGEVAYLSKMEGQYQFHGVEAAQVLRRMSARLITPHIKRLLKKIETDESDFLNLKKEILLKKILKDETGFDSRVLQTELDEAAKKLVRLMDEKKVPSKSVEKFLYTKIKEAVGEKRAKSKKKAEKVLSIHAELSDQLFPYGKPQERIFNLFNYMNEYGHRELIQFLQDHYQWDDVSLFPGA